MWQKIIHLVFIWVLSSSAWAEGIVATLGSDNARFFYSTQMWGQQAGPVELEMGLFFDEENTFLANLGMMLRNDTMDSPFIFSLGGRSYFASVSEKNTTQDYEVVALALGAELLYVPDNLGGLGIGAQYFYAPDILAGADAEGLTEWGVFLDYQLTPQSNIFMGYRSIEADIKDVGIEVEIDDSFYLGFGIRY
ncbi:MAG: YfaZ family outer membrane protein [Gammaproteobacteria bacterium]|nr:YfaZ family outer membrane protein [Gammaproteobacteria bacterium]